MSGSQTIISRMFIDVPRRPVEQGECLGEGGNKEHPLDTNTELERELLESLKAELLKVV